MISRRSIVEQRKVVAVGVAGNSGGGVMSKASAGQKRGSQAVRVDMLAVRSAKQL